MDGPMKFSFTGKSPTPAYTPLQWERRAWEVLVSRLWSGITNSTYVEILLEMWCHAVKKFKPIGVCQMQNHNAL
jgi:hypothetical protein